MRILKAFLKSLAVCLVCFGAFSGVVWLIHLAPTTMIVVYVLMVLALLTWVFYTPKEQE